MFALFKRKKKEKVFVGLSGGVDSSVSAMLLKRQGYEVVGVFIKTWTPPGFECSWKEDIKSAIRTSAELGIPFAVCDLEKEYKKEVADKMIEGYKKGITPNPDTLCNKSVKFGAFHKWAKRNGADKIATGHYARIIDGKLYRGIDAKKDQSYFLWAVPKNVLGEALFPVGGMLKSQVREIAKKEKLSVFDKKDSQGICFLGKVNMKDFLSEYIDKKPGKVVDADTGEEVGEHCGVEFYTLGQRRGFEVKSRTDERRAMYIVAKDIENNILFVSEKHPDEMLNIANKAIHLEKLNLLDEARKGEKIECQIRYRGKIYGATVGEIDANEKTAKIVFGEGAPMVAPGQSLVMYRGDLCIGGGVVARP